MQYYMSVQWVCVCVVSGWKWQMAQRQNQWRNRPSNQTHQDINKERAGSDSDFFFPLQWKPATFVGSLVTLKPKNKYIIFTCMCISWKPGKCKGCQYWAECDLWYSGRKTGQMLSALTHCDERKPPWKPQQTETLVQYRNSAPVTLPLLLITPILHPNSIIHMYCSTCQSVSLYFSYFWNFVKSINNLTSQQVATFCMFFCWSIDGFENWNINHSSVCWDCILLMNMFGANPTVMLLAKNGLAPADWSMGWDAWMLHW